MSFDKKGALSKKNWLEKKGNEKSLRVYQCDEDDTNWHITSENEFSQHEYENRSFIKFKKQK